MCQDCEYPGQLAKQEPDDYGPVTGPDPWDYRPSLRERLRDRVRQLRHWWHRTDPPFSDEPPF